MGTDVETVVVGGGVVGLGIARALCLAGHEVLLIEQHGRVGTEVSARSSEVVHAGLYYPPGSLKARLCVEGRRLLYRFAAENGVAHRRCGKLLVATHADELPQLARIAETAAKNGVDDLVPLTGLEARRLEPELACVAACLSPSTGVIDAHGLMQALEGHVIAAGGTLALGTRVTGLAHIPEGFEIATGDGDGAHRLTARNLILAAGLGGTRLGRMLAPDNGGYRVPETYPAKGHYFALAGKAPFRHLVYPVPQGAWLGIHLTLDVAGQARFGPDLEWTAEASYDFEDRDGRRREMFEREVRRYWPGLPDGALAPGYTGVRPKIYRKGEPAPDFAIHGPADHGIARLVALYGIESPGLTSSLAIADHVAAMLR